MLKTQTGEIFKVNRVNGVATGSYQVKLVDGSLLKNVLQLLPMSAHAVSAESGRVTGGSGLLPIAPEGSTCLVSFIGDRGSGKAQPYIVGFFGACTDDTTSGPMGNSKRVQPGGFSLLTPFGTGITVHASGAIEIEASDKCVRKMTPLYPDHPGDSVAAIVDLCRNYVLKTASGIVKFGEMTKGRSGYRATIYELSRWSPAISRKSRNLAGSGVDARTASDDEVETASADRFVEIEYGSLEKKDGIYRERFVGRGSVELFCDGAGGWKTSADESTEELVGDSIHITASKDGQRTVLAKGLTYTIEGSVAFLCDKFSLAARRVEVAGMVLLNEGVVESARRYDVVRVGSHIGMIITGDPMVRHGAG